MKRAYGFQSGRNREDWQVIHPEGTEELGWFQVRLDTLPELAAMLERVSLVLKQVFGGMLGESYGFDSPRLVVLSRKP